MVSELITLRLAHRKELIDEYNVRVHTAVLCIRDVRTMSNSKLDLLKLP